jgi:hypothetical protein
MHLKKKKEIQQLLDLYFNVILKDYGLRASL